MSVAKPLFVLLLTAIISALASVTAFAAEPEAKLEPKAKSAPKVKPAPVGALGGFSLTPTVGGYSFAGSEHRDPAQLYGLKIGYDKIGKSIEDSLGVEATFNYFTAKSKTVANDTTGYLVRLDAVYPFVQGVKWMPFFAAGAGGIAIDNGVDPDLDINLLLNYGLGLKYFFENYLAVRVDGRHLIIYNNNTSKNNFEVGVGVSYYFGKTVPPMKTKPAVKNEPKKESDGVPLEKVLAPLAPLTALIPPSDSDGDSVIDTLDKCPQTPPGVEVDGNGCPPDSDKDGVRDYLDKCPGTPTGAAVDDNGCPPDSDNDRVPDYLDKCPGTPTGVAVDVNGCPLDADNDGVVDSLDKCPATPVGVSVDADGCTIGIAKKFCNKPAIIAISFDSNKADIKASYHAELDKLGNFLKEFPGSKGTIDGYTDTDGSKAANLILSQARADRIRSYLVNKFEIDSKRIGTKGYGTAKPIASNKYEAGKAKNRRIEAVFICD
jgi:OOP family OmpA-OmpF porin